MSIALLIVIAIALLLNRERVKQRQRVVSLIDSLNAHKELINAMEAKENGTPRRVPMDFAVRSKPVCDRMKQTKWQLRT